MGVKRKPSTVVAQAQHRGAVPMRDPIWCHRLYVYWHLKVFPNAAAKPVLGAVATDRLDKIKYHLVLDLLLWVPKLGHKVADRGSALPSRKRTELRTATQLHLRVAKLLQEAFFSAPARHGTPAICGTCQDDRAAGIEVSCTELLLCDRVRVDAGDGAQRSGIWAQTRLRSAWGFPCAIASPSS